MIDDPGLYDVGGPPDDRRDEREGELPNAKPPSDGEGDLVVRHIVFGYLIFGMAALAFITTIAHTDPRFQGSTQNARPYLIVATAIFVMACLVDATWILRRRSWPTRLGFVLVSLTAVLGTAAAAGLLGAHGTGWRPLVSNGLAAVAALGSPYVFAVILPRVERSDKEAAAHP
jgi:hypothetical protein